MSGSVGLIEVAAIAIYAFVINDSGHTAVEPFLSYLFFIPLLVISIFVWRKNHLLRRVAMLTASIALLGIVLIVVLDVTNYLVQYDRWLKRGLPDRGCITWSNRSD